MTSKTNEQALESAIEKSLTRTCLEELREQDVTLNAMSDRLDDAHFTLLYPLPLASRSVTVKKNFESSQFRVTRQLRYSTSNPGEEIYMVLFVNGLPSAAMELKNHWTGQTAKVHGQNQYKFKRDITQPLLNFGRCIVHFVVDTDEVYMTTKLNGAGTFFLPFNLGINFGKGNPPNTFGHKTSYLWEDVFTRRSIANISQHFVRFDGKYSDPLQKKTLFPVGSPGTELEFAL